MVLLVKVKYITGIIVSINTAGGVLNGALFFFLKSVENK